MEAFKSLTSTAVRLDIRNMDTDQVVPARFLRTTRKEGYADFLFHDLRIAPDGTPLADFPLNRPEAAGARILVAGENFGCGSSREGAVFALFDANFRCVIAPSVGDIFRNNCYKNGVLPVILPLDDVDSLGAPGLEISVDLATQTVKAAGKSYRFDIEPFWKECLFEGVDDIDLTLRYKDQIAGFAKNHFASQPWLALEMPK